MHLHGQLLHIVQSARLDPLWPGSQFRALNIHLHWKDEITAWDGFLKTFLTAILDCADIKTGCSLELACQCKSVHRPTYTDLAWNNCLLCKSAQADLCWNTLPQVSLFCWKDDITAWSSFPFPACFYSSDGLHIFGMGIIVFSDKYHHFQQ